MESDIIVRECKTRDAKDLLENEYPFDDINEFGTWYKDTRLKIISFLEGRPRKRFVAYSLKEKKAVGTAKRDMITRNLCHVGGIFVVPSHRGRGIATLIQNYHNDYLKKIGIRKLVGNIETTNFPSINMITKSLGSKFLQQSYYRCEGEILEKSGKDESEGNKIIKLDSPYIIDRETLYRIYQACVNEEWRKILEIDKENFLDRFWGCTRLGGLLKLLVRNRVVIIKERDENIGYFHHTTRLLPIKKEKRKTVYLYLTPTKLTKNILEKIPDFLGKEEYEEISLVFTNKNMVFMEEIADILQNSFQFNKSRFLIFYDL